MIYKITLEMDNGSEFEFEPAKSVDSFNEVRRYINELMDSSIDLLQSENEIDVSASSKHDALHDVEESHAEAADTTSIGDKEAVESALRKRTRNENKCDHTPDKIFGTCTKCGYHPNDYDHRQYTHL